MFKFLAVTTLFATVALGDNFSEHVPKRDSDESSSHNAKIISGTETNIEEYPYQISIGYQEFNPAVDNYIHHCGGCIISKNWVLTAAHCLTRNDSITTNSNIVKAGATNKLERPSDDPHGVSLHRMALRIIHPQYIVSGTRQIFPHDIGLILVVEPFQYDASRQPIPLYREHQRTLEGLMATVSGWGKMRVNYVETYPENLQTVSIPIMSRQECSVLQRNHHYDGQICVSSLDRKAACDGDSGGPVTVVTGSGSDRKRYLVGVVSGGTSVCIQFAIITDVAYYLPWIEQQISDRSDRVL